MSWLWWIGGFVLLVLLIAWWVRASAYENSDDPESGE